MQELRRRVVTELEIDDEGLWRLVLAARNLLGRDDEKRAVLALISDLLESSEAIVGFPTRGGGFDAWDVPPSEAVGRIDREWSESGRDPNIGEIAWLARADRRRADTDHRAAE